VFSANKSQIPKPKDGEIVTGFGGNVTVFTTEDEAYALSRELARMGLKFAVNPISLDDIFLYLVGRRASE